MNQGVQKPINQFVTNQTDLIRNDTVILPIIKFADHYYFDTILTVGRAVFRIFRDKDSLYRSFNLRIFKRLENGWQDNINQEWTSIYEFKDWNKDGYVDIVLRYKYGYELLLFNPQKGIFVVFGGISGYNIENVQNISGTNLKCNFSQWKSDWHSELFSIDSNYNKISYGIILYRHYHNEVTEIDSPSIDIYRKLIIHNEAYQKSDDNNNENRVLITTINPKKQKFYTDTIASYDSLRLEFIRDYWSKNYQKFVKSKKY